jgi:hypothetical protein
MKCVVKNGQGFYLQDQGCLETQEFPYGGPARFGDVKTAHVFKTKAEATIARKGLLGPGRSAEVVPYCQLALLA